MCLQSPNHYWACKYLRSHLEVETSMDAIQDYASMLKKGYIKVGPDFDTSGGVEFGGASVDSNCDGENDGCDADEDCRSDTD